MKKIETEAHVKELVREWFKARGGWRFSPVQTGMGEHGIPDSVGGVPILVTPEMVGRTICISVTVEAKKPGRRGEKDRGMSKHQVLFQERVRAAHGISVCCDSIEDLQWLDRDIRALQYAKPSPVEFFCK